MFVITLTFMMLNFIVIQHSDSGISFSTTCIVKKNCLSRIPHYRTEPKLHQAFPTAKKIQQKNNIISAPHTRNLVLESNLLRSIEICVFVRIAMNLVSKTDSAGMTVSTRTAASEGIMDSTGIIPSWV
jgi:hypothetical protein